MNKKLSFSSLIKNPFVLGFLLVALGIAIAKSGYQFGQWLFAFIH